MKKIYCLTILPFFFTGCHNDKAVTDYYANQARVQMMQEEMYQPTGELYIDPKTNNVKYAQYRKLTEKELSDRAAVQNAIAKDRNKNSGGMFPSAATTFRIGPKKGTVATTYEESKDRKTGKPIVTRIETKNGITTKTRIL